MNYPRTMEQERRRTLLGMAMVGLGLVQVVLGILQDNLPFAFFGLTYALIGVASLWLEM